MNNGIIVKSLISCVLLSTLAIAGCGSSSTVATPTATATLAPTATPSGPVLDATYNDQAGLYTFKYPSSWVNPSDRGLTGPGNEFPDGIFFEGDFNPSSGYSPASIYVLPATRLYSSSDFANVIAEVAYSGLTITQESPVTSGSNTWTTVESATYSTAHTTNGTVTLYALTHEGKSFIVVEVYDRNSYLPYFQMMLPTVTLLK
jgi:hypothetical protein